MSELARRAPILLGMSGRFAAGKDTVGSRVLQRVRPDGWQRSGFGDAIRLEGNQVAEIVDDATSDDRAAAALVAEFSLSMAQSRRAVQLFKAAAPALRRGTRSTDVRAALQHWGILRGTSDPDHWLRLAADAATRLLRNGTSVLMPDVRMVREANWVVAGGHPLVRLDITSQTQQQRTAQRDGAPVATSVQRHESEVALDSYPCFTIRVSNDLPVPSNSLVWPVVNTIVDLLCGMEAEQLS